MVRGAWRVAQILSMVIILAGSGFGKETSRLIPMRDSTFTIIQSVTVDSNSSVAVWFPFDIVDDDWKEFKVGYTGALTVMGWVDSVKVGTNYAQAKDSLGVVSWLTFIRKASYDTTKYTESRLHYQVIGNPVGGDTVHVTAADFNWGTGDTADTYSFSKAVNVRACHGLKVVLTNGHGASRCVVALEVIITEDD